MLEEAGFSAAENRVVIRAALKNHQNPMDWARKAIALRAHVSAGLPLQKD